MESFFQVYSPRPSPPPQPALGAAGARPSGPHHPLHRPHPAGAMPEQPLPQHQQLMQATSNFCPCTHGGGGRLARSVNRVGGGEAASSSSAAVGRAPDGGGGVGAEASAPVASADAVGSFSVSAEGGGGSVRFVDENRSERLVRAFRSLHDTKQFADVEIVVGDETFQAHKNILAISSPFFMGMFSHSLLESVSSRVTLADMEPATFELVLAYVYTGEVELSLDTVQCLLSAANLLQLPALKAACADFMRRHVTRANCLPVYFFARLHDCYSLALLARSVIGSCFQEVCKLEEFLNLPVDKLAEIIRDDFLAVPSEEAVFEACLDWLALDPRARQPHLFAVMQHVRFACMSCYYLCDRVECELTLQADEKVQELLRRARYHHMLPNRRAELDLNSTPRSGMSYVRGFLVIANPYTEDKTRKFNSVELLLPTLSGQCASQYHLIKIAKLPLSLYMPGVAITGTNQLLLAGGTQKKISVRGCVTCDGVSNQLHSAQTDASAAWSWQPLPRMSVPRTQFPFVLVDQAVFAVGGFTGQEVTDQVERFCLQALAWFPAAPLPQPLRCSTGHAYRGKLYVFGGENADGDIVSACYRYDPQADVWSELPPMQTPRALAGCAVHRDRLYVIGGNTGASERWRKEVLPEFCTNTVELLDPASLTWHAGPPLPNLLCGAGVAKLSGCLRVIGGEDDKSWMAGECRLVGDRWVEAQQPFHAAIMSTFGCAVASVTKELLRKCAGGGGGGGAGGVKCPLCSPAAGGGDFSASAGHPELFGAPAAGVTGCLFAREQSPRPVPT